MLRHLFTAWSQIETRLASQTLFIFLDYDGTLTPIVSTPDEAVLSRKGREVLTRLTRARGVQVAVVTGRALRDIRRRVGIEGVVYAANHGLEAEGPGIRFAQPEALKLREEMGRMAALLKDKLAFAPGAQVEDKGLTLSVHFRNVPQDGVRRVEEIFRENTGPQIQKKVFTLFEGKKVWELRPSLTWNKGSIVRWLLDKTSGAGSRLACYFGDDRTDEDAFQELGSGGITVKVDPDGGGGSAASYYLTTPGEVLDCLERIINVRR